MTQRKHLKKRSLSRSAKLSCGSQSALKGARTVREGAVRNVLKGNALAAYFTVFIFQSGFTGTAGERETPHEKP
jgi:hypothetical protein